MSWDVELEAVARGGVRVKGDWRRYYVPEDADRYSAELDDLEYELDTQFPNVWRNKLKLAKEVPSYPPELQGFLRKRLRRRTLIMERRGAWGVRMARRGERVWANPVRPPAEPGLVVSDAYDPIVSPNLAAHKLGSDAKTIKALLRRRPPEVRGVYRWLAAQLEAAAPSPPGPAPDDA